MLPNTPALESPPASLGTRSGAGLVAHASAAVSVAGMLIAASAAPDEYNAAMQEDRLVEWWTALLFLGAAVIALPRVVRERRLGDLFVVLFCLVAAGEEVSWGQRLVGYTPPAAFLEHNTQQELNLHNFRDVLGQPKWLLVMILGAYGLVVPLADRTRVGKRLWERLRLTVPSSGAVPWFAAAILLLAWYPVEYTGEWVETLAASLFLITRGDTPARTAGAAFVALALAGGLAFASAQRAGDAELVTCAKAELQALRDDMNRAATPRLWSADRVHKRLWTASQDGYLEWDSIRSFLGAECRGADVETVSRRRFGVDPWGTAYWMLFDADADSALVLYSFGPNRRRDRGEGAGAGDDIVVTVKRHDDGR